ncbi:hypothetical protein GGG16DRAFT_63080 [Schizophyllum commune]
MQAGPSGSRKRRPSQSPSRSDDEPRPEKKQKTKAALFVQKLNRKRENHKKTQKPKEQSRTSHHVTSKEIPQDAEETKLAVQTHIRFLAKLYEQNALPTTVSQAMRDSYSKEFKTPDNVRLTVKTRLNTYASKLDSVHERVQAERNALESKRSQLLTQTEGYIVAWIAGISEFAMQTIYAMLAASGCTTWAPDLGIGNDPDSLYNLFHEDLALRSFRQAVAVGGYDHLGVNMAYANKLSFTRKVYRSFVFHYLKEKLARARTAFVGKMQGCPAWTQALCIENEAHSDDEFELVDVATPDGVTTKKAIYTIRKKEGRSDKVTAFFRMVDRSRVPIDYFSPQYWNETLTLRDRVEYLGSRKGCARVGLPKPEFCKTWADISKWIHLSEDEFMAKYGDDVLAEYAIPTDAQIAMIEKGEDAVPEESDEDTEEEEEEFEEWEGPKGTQEPDNSEDEMSTGEDGQ